MKGLNYQVMTDKLDGKYIPDYEGLIKNASCEEEIEFVKNIRTEQENRTAHGQKPGFHWNLILIQRQACGHYELFQSPCDEKWTLESGLRLARSCSAELCSKCLCKHEWEEL